MTDKELRKRAQTEALKWEHRNYKADDECVPCVPRFGFEKGYIKGYKEGSKSGETMKDMQVRLFKLEKENAELKEYKDKYHSTLRRIYSD